MFPSPAPAFACLLASNTYDPWRLRAYFYLVRKVPTDLYTYGGCHTPWDVVPRKLFSPWFHAMSHHTSKDWHWDPGWVSGKYSTYLPHLTAKRNKYCQFVPVNFHLSSNQSPVNSLFFRLLLSTVQRYCVREIYTSVADTQPFTQQQSRAQQEKIVE